MKPTLPILEGPSTQMLRMEVPNQIHGNIHKHIRHSPHSIYGWLSKLWSLFGSLKKYGTYYLGYPKRDHNFDNHPSIYIYIYTDIIYTHYRKPRVEVFRRAWLRSRRLLEHVPCKLRLMDKILHDP